jgi:pimeloyl-ACP methyl ester carboxylesterase
MSTTKNKVESRFVEAEGWRIHYTVHGEDGPALILLHGGDPGATGLSNYSKNIAALSAHFTTYVIDFPGWGRSSKNLGPGNPFERGGQVIGAFIKALDLGKVSLVGNSFGGSSALYAALNSPDLVDRLVLMGPGGALIPGSKGPTPGIMQLLTYYMGEGPTLEKLQGFIQNLVFDPELMTSELVKQRFEASADPEIIANPPLRLPPGAPPADSYLCNDPRLATLANPTLFIWGLEDKVNPWEGVLTFRAIPDQDVVLLSRCGHWAQWEHPAKFNALALDFLRRYETSGRV